MKRFLSFNCQSDKQVKHTSMWCQEVARLWLLPTWETVRKGKEGAIFSATSSLPSQNCSRAKSDCAQSKGRYLNTEEVINRRFFSISSLHLFSFPAHSLGPGPTGTRLQCKCLTQWGAQLTFPCHLVCVLTIWHLILNKCMQSQAIPESSSPSSSASFSSQWSQWGVIEMRCVNNAESKEKMSMF